MTVCLLWKNALCISFTGGISKANRIMAVFDTTCSRNSVLRLPQEEAPAMCSAYYTKKIIIFLTGQAFVAE